MLLGTPCRAAGRFTDARESDWFYSPVDDRVSRGVVSGVTSTAFQPCGTVTRAQAITFGGRYFCINGQANVKTRVPRCQCGIRLFFANGRYLPVRRRGGLSPGV
jgi:hypothetical protein